MKTKSPKLFVVGKFIRGVSGGAVWEFEGVFDSREKAIAACKDKKYFIGPCLLNQTIKPGVFAWPGLFYPLAKGGTL